tara:strand:- start:45 stop:545 length:501 start_codon:yes stop_codon:yes gene_type:complete
MAGDIKNPDNKKNRSKEQRKFSPKKKKQDFLRIIDGSSLNDPKNYNMEEIVIMNPEIKFPLNKAKGGRVTLKDGTENPLKDKIDSLKKKNFLSQRPPEDSKIKKRLKKLKENDLNTLPRGLKMDTTTSSYGDSGQGRKVPQFKDGGRVAKGCGAILSNRRKKTKYF